jgi:hypothetical protein
MLPILEAIAENCSAEIGLPFAVQTGTAPNGACGALVGRLDRRTQPGEAARLKSCLIRYRDLGDDLLVKPATLYRFGN